MSVAARLTAVAAALARSTALLVLQIGGLGLAVFGVFLLAPWLACIVGGVLLFALGWLFDKGGER